ncbi:unnamed protein product [Prorocentrum cordatum]|uniref:Uncharacterized protein n=1 Tax=Prorocentrum cordatum TaxID=2364126 RepID=A0ABN9YDG3_9DINO|nr:unnamed protein product [Polarella glacialis]
MASRDESRVRSPTRAVGNIGPALRTRHRSKSRRSRAPAGESLLTGRRMCCHLGSCVRPCLSNGWAQMLALGPCALDAARRRVSRVLHCRGRPSARARRCGRCGLEFEETLGQVAAAAGLAVDGARAPLQEFAGLAVAEALLQEQRRALRGRPGKATLADDRAASVSAAREREWRARPFRRRGPRAGGGTRRARQCRAAAGESPGEREAQERARWRSRLLRLPSGAEAPTLEVARPCVDPGRALGGVAGRERFRAAGSHARARRRADGPLKQLVADEGLAR